MLLLCCTGVCCLSLRADTADSLRRMLPRLHGEARLAAYEKLYRYSVIAQKPLDERIQVMNDYIAEAERQQKDSLLGIALVSRSLLFYNNDLSDSVYLHVPKDLETLRGIRQWGQYYELWTCLINTYVFSGKYNFAMREVQQMVDDAKTRQNTYGLGMAYYMLGNVYSNMHNREESAAAYRKAIDLLQDIKPTPVPMADLYSYYGDVLNDMGAYAQLEQMTVEWHAFLERFLSEVKMHEVGRNIIESYYFMACAQAAIGLRQWDKADKMLAEVHQRSPHDTDYIGQSWLFYKAELCIQQQRYHEALELNDRHMEQLDDSDIDTAIRVKNQRAAILRGLGQYREAADLLQAIVQVKDSVSGAEIRNQLNEMNTLFKVDELKLAQQQAQFRNTMIIVGIIVLALVVFTVFRIRAARRLKKAHNELEKTHGDLLVAYDQLEETTTAKERIESDLRIARNIQMGMVPHTFPERDDVDLYASMTPAKEVGGDLYDYLIIDNLLYFCLGDVSGKGVPASLFMAMARNLFHVLAQQQLPPAEIATRMNAALSEDNETGMFVTMFLGVANLSTGHLDFCNAGHNPPVLMHDDTAEFIEMEPNAPIGLWPELDYEGESIADISNKTLFVYTDGLNEAENRQQEQFSDERLVDVMQTSHFESSRQTVDTLKELVEQHRDGAEPNDDLTMLCVKVIRNVN